MSSGRAPARRTPRRSQSTRPGTSRSSGLRGRLAVALLWRWSSCRAGAQPDGRLDRPNSLLDGVDERLAQPDDVDLVPKPIAEGVRRLLGVVASAVEALIDRALDPPSEGLECR